jgi:Fis family transcriptional regulator
VATHPRDDHEFASLSELMQSVTHPVSFKGMAVMPIASLKKMLPHKVILAKDISALLESTVGELHGKGLLYHEAVRAFQKRFIVAVLADCGWNQCQAARLLEMHRNTLHRTIKELGLNLAEERRNLGTRKRPRRAGIFPGSEHASIERGK